ncbi:MAG: 3-isopropylmalate dehydratase small subunit [Woeseiaceae bacterium]|nr:3-isopropylmalate dehydratase small subunit [Woeseiaceae bacterium]
MKRLEKINSKILVLPNKDVDTDQIIPARFLTTTSKDGLGKHLFHDWRYEENGDNKPDFVLNKHGNKKIEILVAGNNFGCGSSREHAPWALTDYGFRAVISSKIADIFKSNALKNGLLPIVVSEKILNTIMDKPDSELSICVQSSKITLPNNDIVEYEIDEFSKFCLIEGIDQLGFIQRNNSSIVEFEEKRNWTP